ncbi:hypothetical protein PIB30_055946 [Stylosanthes scabra]|uniref:Uncharacterized protein n=1 Tax=Stylosanthes scabra TaxID=79078 RepID=A0ABU6YL27_9FABA|nr:hypothetical protein [Stylosanthes scabra]
MPWGECNVTLEDVAYQLGLPINGEPVSRCLWDFENLIPKGTGRPRWDWFLEMFGELLEDNDRDACTMTFSWLKSRFGDLSDGASDEQPTGMSSRWQGRWICCRAGFSGGFRSFSLTVSPHIRREGAPIAGSQEAARFDALQRVCLSPVSDFGGRGRARSSYLYTSGPSSGTGTDVGVTSGFRRRISAGMVSGQPGGRGCRDNLTGLSPIHPSDPGDRNPIKHELSVAAGAGHQFDGSQVHLDLNEHVSGPSHMFMALGGTPPSAAHVPGGSWEVPFMEPAHLSTPPASPAQAEQTDEPAARGRARRAPSRRGCGTRGHM